MQVLSNTLFKDSQHMQSWLNLEQRFRSLISSLGDARLDDQTGSQGEHWRIACGYSKQAIREFELLSILAGKLLNAVGENKTELTNIIHHSKPDISWYRALKEFSNAHESKFYAITKDERGNETGVIFTGTIYNIAENSANLCLYMEVNYPLKSTLYKKLWVNYGREILVGVIVTLLGAALLAIF